MSIRAPRLRPLLLTGFLAALTWMGPTSLHAQSGNHYRVGLTLGGTSFVGLSFEYRFGDTGLDLTVGSFALQDVSVSLVGKQYLGESRVRPYLGGGLWGILALPEDGRRGWVLILRAPVGLDWSVADAHAFGFEVNVNRALAVRRSDPKDTRGPASRIVPLPAVYYRWASSQPPGR